MSVKLLIEHHLRFLSLKGDCTGSSQSTLVKISHCWKSHVAAHSSNASFQVGFLSAMLVDDGESVFVKGLRICEEYEGRKLMPIFGVPVSEWAKTLGANKFVSTYSDTFRPSCRPISKMVRCLCYVIAYIFAMKSKVH